MPPEYTDSSSPAGEQPPGTVEVGHQRPGLAIVALRGEHDISTEPALARALTEAAARSDVVVDLSECTFIDSTVIASLIKGAAAVTERGERFALVIPPEQRHVSRIAQMVRLAEFLSVHDSRDAALASLG